MMNVSNKGNKVLKQWSSSTPLFSGIDISADDVYNLADGVVIQVSRDFEGKYTVDVQFNASVVLRYSNIISCNVSANSKVLTKSILGKADCYIHLEYLKAEKSYPVYPVRIGKTTYYKHNPGAFLNGEDLLNRSGMYGIEVSVSNEYVPMKFTRIQDKEFSNIGGETYVEF